jgi:hypothetical protein
MNRDAIAAELEALGWTLVDGGPKQTPSGWRATAQHEDATILAFCPTEQDVLDDILSRVKARVKGGS